jgi:putative flippase GtrA
MRALTFVGVGTAGFALQIAVITVLTTAGGWSYVPATAVAVEAAVLHNFWWHERWTWGNRGFTRPARLRRLWRYHLATGAISIAGTLLLTVAMMELTPAPVPVANAAAVAMMAAANFTIADRWVFTRGLYPALAVGIAGALAAPPAEAAGPDRETIAAWNRFVAGAEARLHACGCDMAVPNGRTTNIPGGTIHHWRGSMFIPQATVAEVLEVLMYPGTPPPQADVIEARVLSRSGSELEVYIRLSRRAIVSVTYDTEHHVSFARHSEGLATSRSVATRIREVEGGDRGFLWRLNSYWRYTQQQDGVRIDLESLSLSRRVPRVIAPAANPLINRVGRESMIRTLEAVRAHVAARRSG